MDVSNSGTAKVKRSCRGFTMLEMLVVVLIIGILAAIAIPVFTSQIERARERTDEANLRSAGSLAVSDYMVEERSGSVTYYFASDISGIAIAYMQITTDAGTVSETCSDASGVIYPVNSLIKGQSSQNEESTIIVTVENNAIVSAVWGAAPTTFS